jgi:hypothetical protein
MKTQAVVLFIDLCHHKADDSPDLEDRRNALRDALNLFKSVSARCSLT